MSLQDDELIRQYAHFSRPLTEAQLAALEPALHRLAVPLSRCANHRNDLVQTAYLALIDGRRKWTNPLVCALSAMQDHVRLEKRWLDAVGPVDEPTAGDDGLRSLLDSETADRATFSGLWLEERVRQAAVMHWVDGVPQWAVGERFGVCQATVGKWLAEAREAVREHWTDLPNGGDE